MAQAMRPNTTTSLFATDGKPHPLQDSLVAVAMILGAIAIISSLFSSLHLLSSWAGLIGVLTGAYGQFISVTTRERFGLILGLGASAIGLFIGMAHGGLFGGVIG
ncbi:hypothetical protein ACFC18_27615 [Streptomyces sp. NPDC056121]|jgi:hypothetical protein|uniref:hypothetical protein n=1 Tax=Streptomyces TaxID=1883 RepID=UPI001D09EFFF|nr:MULTISPECIES: hypothetical protein [Streptomyces]MCX5082821.1 hypothetical protein [Streptomyces sp. NBC_00401]UDM00954.1 hypothetical protein LGI35_23115 [Streptomyces longhuiensis]